MAESISQPTRYDRAEIRREVGRVAARVTPWEFQQNEEEFTNLLCYLPDVLPQCKTYLEIGAGSGRVAHLMQHFCGFEQLYLIDDDHYHFSPGSRARLLPNATEWAGKSGTPECWAVVASWKTRFDFVWVDGEHTFPTAMADVVLAGHYLNPGGMVGVHDKGWEGVKEWLAAVDEGFLPHLETTEWESYNTKLYRKKQCNA